MNFSASKVLVPPRKESQIGYNDILDKPYIYPHPQMLVNKGRHGSNPGALQNLIMIDKGSPTHFHQQ